MHDFGYDVSNYTEIDPLFGNMDDFDELIREARKKGNGSEIATLIRKS